MVEATPRELANHGGRVQSEYGSDARHILVKRSQLRATFG